MERVNNSITLYIIFITGIALSFLYLYFPITTIVFAASVVVFLSRFFSQRFAVLTVVLLLSFVYGSYNFRNETNRFLELDRAMEFVDRSPVRFEAVITDLPKKSRFGYVQPCRVLEGPVRAEAYLSTPIPFSPGTMLSGKATFRIRGKRVNPGSYGKGPVLFLRPEGDVLKSEDDSLLYLPQHLRWRLYIYFQKNFSDDVRQLLSALVIGHREGDSPLYRAYSKTGLAHLMSVSGTHFGLFSLLVFFIFRNLAKLIPYSILVRITSMISLNELAAAGTLPLILFYLLLSGGRTPAVRAFLMINIFLLGLLLGRRGLWLNSILFAAVVILLLNPLSLVEPSFLLSFAAVLSIGMGLEMEKRFAALKGYGGYKRRFAKFLAVTISAYLGTLPLSVYYFHGLSAVSLMSNLVITPAVCFFYLPIAVCGGIAYLMTGWYPFAGFLESTGGVINKAVSVFSEIPFAYQPLRAVPLIWVPLLYLTVALIIAGRKKASVIAGSALLCSVVLSFSLYSTDYPMVTFLDVGQGDAAVIESKDTTIVVDTGTGGKEVVNYLKARGRFRVDALIISHAHNDHAGGLWQLIELCDLKELWDNGLIIYNPELPDGLVHRRLKAGDFINFDGGSIEILHPHPGYSVGSGSEVNNLSLVFRYKAPGFTVLFTGDVEENAMDSLLTVGRYLRSDVFKVPHHGSYTSNSLSFLQAVNPVISVISLEKGNTYGYPHETTLNNLSFTRLYRTDRDGAIRVYSTGERIVVRRYRDWLLKPLSGFETSEEIENIKRLFAVW